MSKEQLIEDKDLEKLLGEESASVKSEDSQSVEEGSDKGNHPKAGEPRGEDSQVEEKKETTEEDSQVSEKKTSEDSQVEEKKEEDSQVEESSCDDDKKEEKPDFSEDVKALEAAGEGLSEEYKAKAATIFEAAVTSKLNAEKAKLQESYKVKLAEEVNKVAGVITERVDSYLNYVVSNWMEENKVAIDVGLRTELAESFIASLHKVFVENYVEVPASKRDLYSELETKAKGLEESVKTAQEALTEATTKLVEFKRKEIIAEASKGLAATQADRLASLVKDVEFFSEEAFTAKVKTIKESYFKNTSAGPVKTGVSTAVLNEGTCSKGDKFVAPEMKAYVSALSRSGKQPVQKL